MSRFQGDDLLALGVVELLNFVNRGECDGAIVSLFWPFDDARCKPLHADLSLSLPNVRLEGRGWPASWPEKRRSVHRSLRDALDEQFVRVVEGEKPILPTRPGWKRRDFAHLSPVEAATVTAMRLTFDEVLGSAVGCRMRLGICRTCGVFHTLGRLGRPSHFCNDEHKGDYRHTKEFKKT